MFRCWWLRIRNNVANSRLLANPSFGYEKDIRTLQAFYILLATEKVTTMLCKTRSPMLRVRGKNVISYNCIYSWQWAARLGFDYREWQELCTSLRHPHPTLLRSIKSPTQCATVAWKTTARKQKCWQFCFLVSMFAHWNMLEGKLVGVCSTRREIRYA